MYKKFFKRFFDIIVSLFVLPVILIALIIISPLIYLEDKGSIFYNAPRLGKNGKVFKMYKFRSMRMNVPDIRNEDGSTYNSENDARLTRIGKFLRKTSIDEIPQFLNVLKGDMSIIGPRPDLPEHIDFYNENEVRKIHLRPGITGYNQAYFRNSINYRERWANDVFYVDNVSFLFDLKIFIRTIYVVTSRKGVFADGNCKEEGTK